jgi:hypothetical protein
MYSSRGRLRNQVVSTLVWYVMSHWHVKVWIRIRDIFVVLRYYLYLGSCGELHLLVSCCVGDRCDMTSSDEDLGSSRRSGAEDRGWPSTSQVLGGQTIGKSGDIVCGLYNAQGDDKHGFLCWASKLWSSGFSVCVLKPTVLVWWFGSSKSPLRFLGFGLKTKRVSVCLLCHKIDGGRSAQDMRRDLAACFTWKQVGIGFTSLALRLVETRLWVVHVASS